MNDVYAYELESVKPGLYEYAFISIGAKGKIKKVVSMEEIDSGVYNVLLQDEIGSERSGDKAITDNGDPFKVINTVAAIIKDFLDKHPHYWIHFAGSTNQRQQSYQRRVLKETGRYTILGRKYHNGTFEPINELFTYQAFLVFLQE